MNWVIVAGVFALVSGVPAQEQRPPARWSGSITRIETFSGTHNGARVTYRLTERWTDFVASHAEPFSTSLDAGWTVDLSRRDVTSRCTTRIEAHGSGAYPWFMFDVDPFDGKSYVIYSTGTGGGPTVGGTSTQTCEREGTTTIEYEVEASWLPAAPFKIPVDELPPEVDPKLFEVPEVEAALKGTIDRKQPEVLRGSRKFTAESGASVTLSWSLVRSDSCDESEARELVRHERARLLTQEEEGPPVASSRDPGMRLLPAQAHITSNRPLSAQSVGDALTAAVGSASHVTLRDPKGTETRGLRQFALRLGEDGRILPTLAALQREIDRTCVPPGSIEGSRTLLFGSVQWIGDDFRVNVRTVDTETGAVKNTASEGGRGGSAELQGAIEKLVS